MGPSHHRLLITPLPEGCVSEDLATYRAAGGWESVQRAVSGDLSPADIRHAVTESGLRGRGGAAFPVGRKWELAASTSSEVRHVVANGGEHEPGSRKDRLLSPGIHTRSSRGWCCAASPPERRAAGST